VSSSNFLTDNFFEKKKYFFFISWEGAKSLTFPGEFADFLKFEVKNREFFSPDPPGLQTFFEKKWKNANSKKWGKKFTIFDLKFQKVCKSFAYFLKMTPHFHEFFTQKIRICIFPFFFEKSLQTRRVWGKKFTIFDLKFQNLCKFPRKSKRFCTPWPKKKKFFFSKEKEKNKRTCQIFFLMIKNLMIF
jgi:hypothetical protein